MEANSGPCHGGGGSSGLVAEAEVRAEEHRAEGNQHFKAQDFELAAASYRQALGVLKDSVEVGDTLPSQLGRAVRLNLAACLQRLGSDPGIVVQLCDEVLAADPRSAKALFRRGAAHRDMAKTSTDAAAVREALTEARRALREAARLEPTDRQVRTLLDEVTADLKALGGGDSVAGGLRLAFGDGLYEDRQPAEPPPPPVVCSACGREGHSQCGKAMWVAQRAAWLGVPAEEVDRDPPTFEDDGTLCAVIRATRAASAAERSLGGSRPAAPGSTGTTVTAECPGGDSEASDNDDMSSLSETEAEMLGDCLCAVERPYPELRRKLPLPQAVRWADTFWEEPGGR
mmetsp:Transcript_125345/g.360095  ORF Transcript_125345/g.360095 Transcript_125345/m.360095 type:complete len:343 (+) Transcript_125345:56-1084(+)